MTESYVFEIYQVYKTSGNIAQPNQKCENKNGNHQTGNAFIFSSIQDCNAIPTDILQ